MKNKKDIFLLLTDKCTLKCFSCGYGCEDKENNWFISEEQFITTLQQLKKINFNKDIQYTINLTGGDPMLHKDWKKFAFLTIEMFPEAICYISTSGPLLATIDDDILLECCNNNIKFGITLYPSMKLLPMYKTIEEKFLRLGILNYLTWNPMRIIFSKPIIKADKNNKECFQEIFSNYNYCFIYQDNLYNCSSLFYQNVKDKKGLSSYNIYNINKNYNLENFNSQQDCQNCKILFDENILWHFNSDISIDKYSILTPLKDFFLYDYNIYYKMQHDCKEHLECLNNNFFKKYYKKELLHPIAQTRFFNGKADIFIPFNKNINKVMLNLLKEQNDIDKYNVYLVSYTDDLKINSYVYDNFYDSKKNIFFLKANNFLNSIHQFLSNSYLKQKYCLDINDFVCLQDKNFLNNIIEKREIK